MSWILVIVLIVHGRPDHKLQVLESRDRCNSAARAELHHKDVISTVCVAQDGSSSFTVRR